MSYCAMPNEDLQSSPPWFAIHTRYQHEKAVAEILLNKGFVIFLPLYPVARCWRDRTKRLDLPLFPCYVFLRGALDRRLNVLTTPGVHGFVQCGGTPSPIPSAEIEGLRKTIAQRLKIEPHPYLNCGDHIRIKSGPLEGIEGILVRKKNLTRLVLSVELLRRSAAVEVDLALVERVKSMRLAGSYLPEVSVIV